MNAATGEDVGAFLADVKRRVDRRLEEYLTAKLEDARATSADSLELVEGVRALTLRGGKRLRPIVLSAAFRAVDPDRDIADTIDAGASLEVLQSYLLIHDDWMDQDDERRGGPAVHALYRETHGEHLAGCLAILAGDLASAYSLELMLAAPFPASRRDEGLLRFVTIQKEVFFGQHLDLTGNPNVSKMHDLKTGSYTVRGPLLLGALLADASEAQRRSLLAWGNPLGEAFQLRDDLLGTFGDMGATGKPGDDLRNGKHTSLIEAAYARLEEAARAPIQRVLGHHDADDAAVAEAAELLVSCGARRAVEDRLASLLDASNAALEGAPLDPAGMQVLRGVADKLAVRSH